MATKATGPGDPVRDGGPHDVLDLRGIRCPLAWAKAKVHLETCTPRSTIELLIDDPRSLRDLPRAAEANGHHVIRVDAAGPPWRITIEV